MQKLKTWHLLVILATIVAIMVVPWRRSKVPQVVKTEQGETAATIKPLDADPKHNCNPKYQDRRTSKDGSRIYLDCNRDGKVDIVELRGGRHGELIRALADTKATADELNTRDLTVKAAAMGLMPCDNGKTQQPTVKANKDDEIRLWVCGEQLTSYNFEGDYIARQSKLGQQFQKEFEALSK